MSFWLLRWDTLVHEARKEPCHGVLQLFLSASFSHRFVSLKAIHVCMNTGTVSPVLWASRSKLSVSFMLLPFFSTVISRQDRNFAIFISTWKRVRIVTVLVTV